MVTIQEAQRGGTESAKSRIQRTLRQSPMFERASRSTRDAVIEAATVEVLPGETRIIEQDATASTLVVLGRGRARIERATTEGRTVPLGYRGSGDVLGESCLGKSRKHTESASAMEEAEVVRIPLDLVLQLMTTDAALGASVVTLLLDRQRQVEDRIESMLFRNVEGRLIEFLLQAADRWGVPTPRGALISAPITHLEIAQSIGSTRETVTLTLGALRREGLLDVAGRRLIVRDRDALAARM
jgi:CRP-like cAMP-binding protein